MSSNSDVELKGTLKFFRRTRLRRKARGRHSTPTAASTSAITPVVKGNISAGSVVLRGKINGNVTATRKDRYQDQKRSCSATFAHPKLVMGRRGDLRRPNRGESPTRPRRPRITEPVRNNEPRESRRLLIQSQPRSRRKTGPVRGVTVATFALTRTAARSTVGLS